MELRDYIHVIRARKWVIIQAVVIVTLTALVVSLLMPKTLRGHGTGSDHREGHRVGDSG